MVCLKGPARVFEAIEGDGHAGNMPLNHDLWHIHYCLYGRIVTL